MRERAAEEREEGFEKGGSATLSWWRGGAAAAEPSGPAPAVFPVMMMVEDNDCDVSGTARFNRFDVGLISGSSVQSGCGTEVRSGSNPVKGSQTAQTQSNRVKSSGLVVRLVENKRIWSLFSFRVSVNAGQRRSTGGLGSDFKFSSALVPGQVHVLVLRVNSQKFLFGQSWSKSDLTGSGWFDWFGSTGQRSDLGSSQHVGSPGSVRRLSFGLVDSVKPSQLGHTWSTQPVNSVSMSTRGFGKD